MEQETTDSLESTRLLLSRAGLSPSSGEIEALSRLFDNYRGRLQLLHAADLDHEEVAGVFSSETPTN